MEIKNQNVDNVVPKSKWEFDADVAHCFANMLERSIPDYRSMRSLVYELGERFIKPQTVITDIGCSTASRTTRLADTSVRCRNQSLQESISAR